MTDRWWRAYDTAVDDPKLLLLSDAEHRAWFNLLCVASIYGGTLPTIDVVAIKLRIKSSKVAAIIAKFIEVELIDKTETGLQPHNWNRRQYKSDVSTERVKRFRVSKRNVSETPPENREQNTERKKESLGRSPTATRPKPSEEFSEFWKTYPRRLGANPKAPAFKVFDAVVKQGADPQAIIAGAKRCAAADHDKIGTPYIPQAVKWLRDRRWEDYAPDTPNAGISDAEREKLFAELRTKSDGKNETQGRNLQPIGAGPCQGEGLGRPKPALPADDQTGQPGVVGMAKILQ